MFNGYMATQAISQAAFQLLCAEVAGALASSDYKTASSKYAQAVAVDTGLNIASISTPSESIARKSSLSDLRAAIQFARDSGDDEDDGRFVTMRTRH